MGYLLIMAGFGIVTGLAAQSRGRNWGVWTVLGLFFGPFALMAVLVMARTAEAAPPRALSGITAAPQHLPPRTRAATPRHPVQRYFVGSDDYVFPVAGESYRQEALERIAGPKTEDGAEMHTEARLKRDRQNAHDPNAVAVLIHGEQVGFVPRDDAPDVAAALDRAGVADSGALADAVITGGWRRFKGGQVDEGSYGVRLDIDWPISLETPGARKRRLEDEGRLDPDESADD